MKEEVSMKKLDYLLIAFVLSIPIFVLNCVAQQNYQPIPPAPGKHFVVTDSLSAIGDLPHLIAKSDLIVEGIVDKVLSTVRSDPDNIRSLKTYTRITINKVIRGEMPKGQQSVAIVEQGGKLDGHEVVYNNNALVQPGDRYILFLSPFHERKGLVEPDLGIPIYSLVGESAGKARVTEQGKIQSTAATFQDSNGMDLESFLAKMKRATFMLEWAQTPRPIPPNATNPPDSLRPQFMIPSK
jgi:hypothetical protein